jgi:hypothetical protein
MQYKIPQNVQIEDKIVWFLTLKQLIIVGVGGGISYALYITLAKLYVWQVWFPATAIPAGLTLLIAFLKVNGIPFGKWVLLTVEFFKNPRKRTFVMGGAENYMATIFAEKPKEVQNTLAIDAASKIERDKEKLKKIGEISKVLDSYGATPSPKPQAA